jgi:hypothetical protein
MNYPTQQSAQGLASLGRGNDSMLVHMTPREVQGLQGLAMAHGGSLTINPETGLPEAGFLDFVLPVAGSFLGLPPWLTASLMAGKTLIDGGDLGDAAMAGLTSYGGAKIGEGLSSFGAAPKVPTAQLNAVKNAPYTGVFGSTGQLGANMGFGSTATSLTDDLVSSIDDIGTKLPSNVGADALAKTQNIAPDFTNAYKGSIDLGTKDLTNLARDNYLISPTSATPTTGLRNLSESFASKPVGVDIPGATTAASNQNMFSGIAEKASKFPDQLGAAVSDPVGFARHIGEGDALLGGAKIGMYGASPFMEDILKPQEYAGYEDPEKGKWTSESGGLSFNPKYSTNLRLGPNLNQPIRAAKGGAISSYAVGGTVTTGGLRDLYGTTDSPSNSQLSRDGYGVGRLDSLAREQAMTQAQTTGYADGGEISNYRQDQAALNLNELPSLNVNTGMQSYGNSGRPQGLQNLQSALSMAGESPNINPGIRIFSRMMSGTLRGDPGMLGMFQGKGAPSSLVSGLAKGGYLNGDGDGMSDSIPATIEGKQPARLADGEFVIPADVVSHLGNGSSKAGSKRLYAMLDKVRHARTGNKKQGKEIKPEKYMPA